MPSAAMSATDPQTLADLSANPKFSAFNLVDVPYKHVSGTTAIPATLLIPKHIKPGKRPVMVRWHGGFMVTGHRLYPDWFGEWILNLALSQSAILISPDYRLMPEAKGVDIVQDLKDFYQWLLTPNNLASHLPSGVDPDLDHLLVTGESAGGWASLQAGLLPESRPHVSALIAQYPMIELRAPFYTTAYEKQLFDPPAPQLDPKILQGFLANLDPGAVVTSAVPPERVPVVLSCLQQGKFGEWFGGDEALYPIEMLDKVSQPLPPLWIMHGKEDNVVPAEGTSKFVEQLKAKQPDAKLHVSYRPGMHGFDNHPAAKLEDEWVKDGVEFVRQHWPKC